MGLEFGVASNQTVWQPEPRGRGTYGILSSCIITMVLCVWTAVHLNLPGHKAREYKYFPYSLLVSLYKIYGYNLKYLPPPQTLRKLQYMFLGLYTPELVAWMAYEQHKEAKRLCEHINGHLGEKPPCSKFEKFEHWLKQCFRGEKGVDIEKGKDVEKAPPGNDSNASSSADMQPMRTESSDAALDSGSITLPPLLSSTSETVNSSEASTTALQTSGNATKKRNHPWTMTHSHYAIMGGFAFDSEAFGDKPDPLPDGRKRLILTPRGIMELVKDMPHLLPDIPESEIKDKSKANGLARALVCLQVLWFAAQCISRMALGMTISLLELNTFAHAICALISYMLWWRKPLDIEEPTLIFGEEVDLACAGLCVQTNLGSGLSILTEDGANKLQENSSLDSDKYVDYRNAAELMPRNEIESDVCETHNPAESANGATFRASRDQTRLNFNLIEIYLDCLRRRRPEIYKLLSDHPNRLRFGKRKQFHVPYIHDWQYDNWWWLLDRSPNSPTQPCGCRDGNETLHSAFFSLCVAGLAYGGLHLLCWSPPLRTEIEVLLWRISGITIVAYGVFLEVSMLWIVKDEFSHQWWSYPFRLLRTLGARLWRSYPFRLSRTLGVWVAKLLQEYSPRRVRRLPTVDVVDLFVLFLILVTLFYVLCRIYLVVECFISISNLPEAVFETPHWAQYFPHFG